MLSIYSEDDNLSRKERIRILITIAIFAFCPLYLVVLIAFNKITKFDNLKEYIDYKKNHNEFPYKILLKENIFTSINAIGQISDIRYLNNNIYIAGTSGAIITNACGKSNIFDGYSDVMFTSLNQKNLNFLSYSETGSKIFLLDGNGNNIWQAYTIYNSGSFDTLFVKNNYHYQDRNMNDINIRRSAFGDLYGDRNNQFIITSYLYPNKLRLYNTLGQLLWEDYEQNAYQHQYVFADMNNGIYQKIITIDDGAHLIVRNTKGIIINNIQLPIINKNSVFTDHFSITKWPTYQSSDLILISDNKIIRVINMLGKQLAQFDIPLDFQVKKFYSRPHSIPVIFEPTKNPYYAILISDDLYSSVLFIYDSLGALVYQKIIPYPTEVMNAIPSRVNMNAQDILIGGLDGQVVQYTFAGKEK